MARFLTTAGTVAAFEQLIRNSKRELIVITPFLKLSNNSFGRLKQAADDGKLIELVYGKDELREEEHRKLRELSNLRLYFLKDLHAKCYSNESEVIVSSLNLYEFSEQNNREMSVLLSSSDDPEAFASARDEIRSIIRAATLQERPGVLKGVLRGLFGAGNGAPAQVIEQGINGRPGKRPATGQPARPKEAASNGHCIRCGTRGRYSPHSPLCGPCYGTWAEWQNDNYPERFCHRCGVDADVTKVKPLCYTCFRDAPFATAGL
jgi:hypothetical protein